MSERKKGDQGRSGVKIIGIFMARLAPRRNGLRAICRPPSRPSLSYPKFLPPTGGSGALSFPALGRLQATFVIYLLPIQQCGLSWPPARNTIGNGDECQHSTLAEEAAAAREERGEAGEKRVYVSAMFLTFSPLPIVDGGRADEERRKGRDWPHFSSYNCAGGPLESKLRDRGGRKGTAWRGGAVHWRFERGD